MFDFSDNITQISKFLFSIKESHDSIFNILLYNIRNKILLLKRLDTHLEGKEVL